MRIKIATDYSTAPGPRRMKEGRYSGEEFRKRLLLPRVKEAAENGSTVEVDLDGTSGYGTSFLEEVFGGLIRNDKFDLATLHRVLQLTSNEEPSLLEEIAEYMNEAEQERAK